MHDFLNRVVLNQKLCTKNFSLSINTIDLHTEGEPLRVVVNGFPKLKGTDVLSFRRDFQNHYDHLRMLLINEPRGHRDMYGCVLTPANDSNGHFGVVFFHNEGYSTMCGHAIIALTTLVLEMDWIEISKGVNNIVIDTPCGRIESWAEIKNNKVLKAGFFGVPSFVLGLDYQLHIPGIGSIEFDIAYGGAFYVYIDIEKNDLNLVLNGNNYNKLVSFGRLIKEEVIRSSIEIAHPFQKDLSFLYGIIFYESSDKRDVFSRNVCVFADGQIDRSPTGSGFSGRIAIMNKRNQIELKQKIQIESIIGSSFVGWIERKVTYGPHDAIISAIEGKAVITGEHHFVLDNFDPFDQGLSLW